MGKKGISWDEKRKRILDIYYSTVSIQIYYLTILPIERGIQP